MAGVSNKDKADEAKEAPQVPGRPAEAATLPQARRAVRPSRRDGMIIAQRFIAG